MYEFTLSFVGTWMEHTNVTASYGESNDEFGVSIDINIDKLLVVDN